VLVPGVARTPTSAGSRLIAFESAVGLYGHGAQR
jgi:hypothetical protein